MGDELTEAIIGVAVEAHRILVRGRRHQTPFSVNFVFSVATNA